MSLLELLSGLDKTKFEPIILIPGEGEMAERAREIGVNVRLWDMPRAKTGNVSRIFSKVLELRSIIKDVKPDVIHTNGVRAQFYAALACKGLKVNLVWHVREAARDIPLYDWFLGVSSKRIICVSNAVKEKRFNHYPFVAPKIRVIYNGVDVHKFKADEKAGKVIRDEIGVNEESVLLGIMGLIIPPKGHRFLFEAFGVIAQKHPDVRLVVAGKTIDKSYKSNLDGLARNMRIDRNINFLGHREDVNAILSALDIFILPSEGEGFSRVIMEALACAKPVITTDVGGNSEAIVNGQSGVLVPYGDVQSLVIAIEYMLEDPERAKKMGEVARERIKELFSVKHHVSSVEKLYEDIIK